MIRSTISVPDRRATSVAEFFPAGAFACFLALAFAVFRPVFAGEGEGERIIRARSFMRSFAEKIASGDTEGLAAMHHPKGIFRSWDEPGDYEEPLDGEEEENLSREQWRQKSVEKFPWLQYSLRGRHTRRRLLPPDSFQGNRPGEGRGEVPQTGPGARQPEVFRG